jgi:Dimerisation domain of Zinc Transporter
VPLVVGRARAPATATTATAARAVDRWPTAVAGVTTRSVQPFLFDDCKPVGSYGELTARSTSSGRAIDIRAVGNSVFDEIATIVDSVPLGFMRFDPLGFGGRRCAGCEGVRWIGHTLRAEADVTVAADISLAEAHDLAHHAEAHLLDDVRRLTAATIHASPAGAHPADATADAQRHLDVTAATTAAR